MIVEFERKLLKNATQVALAKLLEIVSKGAGIPVKGFELVVVDRRSTGKSSLQCATALSSLWN